MAFIAQCRVSLSYANEAVEKPQKKLSCCPFDQLLLPGSQFSCWARVWQGPGACLPWQGTDLLLSLCLPAPQPHPHPSRALHLPTVFLCRSTWQPTPVLLPEDSKDGEAWWATVHGVAESRTRLSDSTFCIFLVLLEKEMATKSSVLAWRVPWP